MKAILLFSSIFYIIGFKIGHKIDLFKNHNRVEKISTTTNNAKQTTKAVYFKDEVNCKTDVDSLTNACAAEKTVLEKNNF